MISVVMPAYNASRFIGPAIESILGQTYQDFEFIVVDDGSADNTPEIVCHYTATDGRIRLITKKHSGISETLNTGIHEATYPWIAVMGADDIALPHRLERHLISASANPRVVAWGADAFHINSRGDVLGICRAGPRSEGEFSDLRRKGEIVYVIQGASLLKRKVILKAGGYDPRFQTAEDMELFDRMANYGPIISIPEPLIYYRKHLQSNSTRMLILQRKVARYLVDRQKARLAGNKELSFDEFLEEYRRQPLLTRLARTNDDLSRFYYNKAGVFFGERRYLAALLFFAVSTALNPIYSLPRIWDQRFSRQTRQWLADQEAKSRA